MPLNYLMDEKFRNLPLRNGVGIVVLNQQNKVFVAKRIDNPKDFWQMPQGGVDDGEKPIDAAYRELDCLLYTSPSPRDKRQSRMPSSA